MWKEPEEFITPLKEPYEASLHHVLEASPQVNSNFLIKNIHSFTLKSTTSIICCDFNHGYNNNILLNRYLDTYQNTSWFFAIHRNSPQTQYNSFVRYKQILAISEKFRGYSRKHLARHSRHFSYFYPQYLLSLTMHMLLILPSEQIIDLILQHKRSNRRYHGKHRGSEQYYPEGQVEEKFVLTIHPQNEVIYAM